jgi:hypothetical protein
MSALAVFSPARGATARVGTARRVLASASLAASAAGLGSLAFDEGHLSSPAVLVVAAVVAAAAVGLGCRSVLVQVLSRGVAWFVLAPMLLGLVEALFRGHLPDAHVVFFATTSAAALLLARPALHTEAARAAFSPVAYRRVFLAGAVASTMTASAMAFFGLERLLWGLFSEPVGPGLALVASAAVLLASAVGVLRMRAWGVLLGGLTSVAALGAALLFGSSFLAIGLLLTALPGLVLASPLLVARLCPGAPAAFAGDRPGRDVTLEERQDTPPPVRARVGGVAEADGEDIALAGRTSVGEK